MPYDLGRGIKIIFIVTWVVVFKSLHHPVLDRFLGFSLSSISVSLLFSVMEAMNLSRWFCFPSISL